MKTATKKHNRNQKQNTAIAPAIMEEIRGRMDSFTKSQRVLAEYVIQRPEKIGFLPIAELAETAGVSVATVVRFCNALGYRGYVELGKKVQKTIQTELSLMGRFSLSKSAAGFSKEAGKTGFERMLAMEMESIGQAAKSINRTDFYKCLEWMATADQLVITGSMASAGLATHFGYAASKVLPNVITVTGTRADDWAFAKRLTGKSVVFGIAFPRYPVITLKTVKAARQGGAKVVSITDSLHSPIVQQSDISFLISVSAAAVGDAFAGPVAFIGGLINEFASQYPEIMEPNLKAFEEYSGEVGAWSG